MGVDPIPVIRGHYLGMLLETLQASGQNYEADLSHFNLPSALPECEDSYVPLLPVLALAQEAAVETSLDDLGLRAGGRLRLSDLSAGLRTALLHSPTLEAALRVLCSQADREMAPLRYRMVRTTGECRIRLSPRQFSDPGDDQFGEWLSLMPVLVTVRHFAGATWTPAAIALRASGIPGDHAREALPRTEFHAGQEETVISFPASLLDLTAIGKHHGTKNARSGDRVIELPDRTGWDLATSLREVLRAYLDDGHPSIELAAEIAGSSVRGLQRQLGKLGLSYSDILQQVRFDTAKRLLDDEDMKVTDAAYALGYSDPAHFTRAFRRMAGVSPRQYRQDRIAV